MRALPIFGALFFMFAAEAAPVPASADVVIGNPPNSNNCYPFGCPEDDWGPEYQQVYASSDFSETITITDLQFYNTQILNGGSPDTGTYAISLSTTSAGVDTLSPTFVDNIGADNTLVYDASLPALSGGVLTLNLSTTFTYNPANGNLLIDVTAPNADNAAIFLFLDAAESAAFSRVVGTGVDTDFGLVTGFSTGSPSVVPEPSTWAMMMLGAAALAYAGYRRSPSAVAAV
jgi:hypothetical protein